jgi:cell division protein FtsI (penicillin-binding protein 3)
VKSKPEPAIAEDDAHEQGDVNAMFAAINDLPSDDPLRAPPAQISDPAPASKQPVKQAASPALSAAAHSKTTSAQSVAVAEKFALREGSSPAQAATNEVTVSDAKKLRVPSLVGLPVRQVIVQAAAAGLGVQISGSGTVREQAPVAGTLVAAGTQIAVRCGR